MNFRWTMKELETMSDNEILRGLITERTSDLNPYAPLSSRLNQIYKKLDKTIEQERIVQSQDTLTRKKAIKKQIKNRVNIDLYNKLLKLDDKCEDVFDKFDHMFSESSDEEISNAVMKYCVEMPYNHFGGKTNV